MGTTENGGSATPSAASGSSVSSFAADDPQAEDESNTSSQVENNNESTTFSGSEKHQQNDKDSEEKKVSWKKRIIRLLPYVIVLLTALGLGLAAYFVERDRQNSTFESTYYDLANQFIDIANSNVDAAFSAMQDLSDTTTSNTLYASSTTNTTIWPNVSTPEWALMANTSRFLAQTPFLAFSPMINDTQNRPGWEAYATANQGWIAAGLQFQGVAANDIKPDPIPYNIHDQDGPLPASAPGPFSPLWQTSPAPNGKSTVIVNYNLVSSQAFKLLIFKAGIYRQGVISSIMQTNASIAPTNPVDVFFRSLSENMTSPQSLLLQPVMSTFADSAPITGHFMAIVAWQNYFENVLSTGTDGTMNGGNGRNSIEAVLTDPVGQSYTFSIIGPTVTNIIVGDQHDPAFDNLVMSSPFACYGNASAVEIPAAQTPADVNPHLCGYTLSIYPTSALQSVYLTNKPSVYLGVVFVIIIVTTLIFLIYDCRVRRQEKHLMEKAERTHALVASLFPKNVHERIMGGDGDIQNEVEKKRIKLGGKTGLKSYLEDGVDGADEMDFDSKPIADLFPFCTVMFCDIVGFTAWSSVREPTQVFTLLEAIFTAFDDIAKQRGVFKVETVGDCYVAVAGLPDPREDHALIMAKYARYCLACVQELLPELEVTLGPDTGDLAMRFGLHSGPVIAGVLRGEKARFQLFGDTMNTTARIETSSERNRIHISQETADLLIEAGKKNWIRAREDVVVAKGKGAMVTYWLLTKDEKSHTPNTVTSSSAGDDAEAKIKMLQIPEPSVNINANAMKVQRLIDWNCDLLAQNLKKIIARRMGHRRSSMSGAASAMTSSKVQEMEAKIGHDGKIVLEEIVEIISMPKFDAGAARGEADWQTIDIGEEAQNELREYVSLIASMYRENPFHSFEHASHVTMSVTKLLSRIVAPEAIVNQEHLSGEDDLAYALHDHTYGITSDPLTQFAVVLSALIHDVDHRGVPNFVLNQEDPTLAAAYHNKSVAEQNSVDLAWNTLMDSSFDHVRPLIYSNTTELKRFRQLLVNVVMATDIFDRELGSLRKKRWDKAFADENEEAMSEEEKLESVNRKATIVIEHIIQASDVAHTMQHWHIYQKWNSRLFEEMYTAFRSGRTDKDPSTFWFQGEIGFFDNYIIPLAKKLKDCGIFGVSSDEYLNYATKNRSEWERKGFEIVNRMVKKIEGLDDSENE